MYNIVYLIAIITIIIYIFYSYYNPKLIYVKSKIDNKTYIVRNIEKKEEAADLLANVSKRLNILIEKFKEKYGNENEKINLLISRFNSHEIRESLPKANQTSYSLNKGERIVLCLRARNSKESLTDINTLMFVALHELAHVMSISVGHNMEFWNNFRFILAHAITWKIYNSTDYKKNPKKYCGIKITESPLDNKNISNYL